MRTSIKFVIILISFLLLSISSEVAFAGPPYITDDPIATDLHHTELFLFGAYENIKFGTELDAPGIEFNYGIFPNVEFALIFSLATVRPNPQIDEEGEEEEVINASGFSDTQVELKYQFLKESTCLPSVAIVPTYVMPTGDDERGLGNGHGWYLLPLWLQKNWGKWTAYGGGGYAYNPVKETNNFWFGGVVVQREINDKLTLGGELYSQGSIARDEKSFTLINLGVTYNLRRDVDLLFSIGNNISGSRAFVSYLGLGFEW